MSENLDIMINILRKYNSIAKKSNRTTDFLLFSSLLKKSCYDFKNIYKQINESDLKNVIYEDNLLGLFQFLDKKSLIDFKKSVKQLQSFKFGNFLFSSNDILEFFINLREFLDKNNHPKQMENLFFLFEKLLLI
ncbi:MAG: hypothetical protein EAX96_01055 [Candidatus Lokiarchaeota archaeon]|nr:hypothetical protein [Candidatus Lokiarchaeota archaeon]